MSQPERQQSVLDLLKGLRGTEPLRQLFWSELNYQRVNQPLSRRGWSESASTALADDPVLFAGGGEDEAFHVIYSRLASDKLLLGNERPVVSRLLNDHPYTLFIFSNAPQDRWHFLNVKYDETSDKRRLFRRITVGPEERLRTASERISLLSLEAISSEYFDLAPLTIQQHHDEAFDVEAVTKKFFDDFCRIFTEVAQDIRQRNGWMDGEAVERETQTLLNRLLFLYFIQRKGWLNRQRDYLYANFKQTHAAAPAGTDYYTGFLSRLFIKLSTEGDYFETLGDLPFLNGGLFNDEYGGQQRQEVLLRRARMKIGNAIFLRVFDDLLEAYNFTVREDTPLNQEVAIDPEMLGKIFESLVLQIEQSDSGGKTSRHDTGSYYTPRPIVHYLCREGLRCWLEQFPPVAAPSPLAESAPASPSPLAESAEQGERAGVRGWPARLEKLLALDASDGVAPEDHAILDACLTPEEARALLERLDNLRACDPAVGSGAFPVGLLHEVLNLRRLCETRSRGRDPVEGDRNWLFDTKARVIERVLYGVDIQERAVEICKLRLWLSLMVDFDPGVNIENCSAKAFADALKKIPSLPNLDFKIRRANSLINMVRGHPVNVKHNGADEKGMLSPILNKLIAAKRLFYDAHRMTDKRRLRFDILDATAELAMYEFNAAKIAIGLIPDEKDSARVVELAAAEREMGWLRQQIRAARKRPAAQQDDELERLGKSFDDAEKPTFVWQLDFAEVFHRGSVRASRAVGSALADDILRNAEDGAPSAAPGGGCAPRNSGFDLMLANPPYVRQEKIKQLKPLLEHYECYTGIADLYVYFYERAVKLLRQGGVLSFISSNKFFRAGYGEKLRRFLSEKTELRNIIDFGDLPIFEATAYPCIVVTSNRKSRDSQPAQTLNVRTMQELARFGDLKTEPLPQKDFGQECWGVESSVSLRLLDKLRNAGKPLREFVGERIYRGLTTGFNEAFVVDQTTRDRLIAEHESSKEILKPYLRGKDVERWTAENNNHFLIKIPSSENHKHPWSGKSKAEAEQIYKKTYPAIHRFHDQFRKELIARYDQGHYFWELRACAYWQEFEKPKILSTKISIRPTFALDITGCYLGNTAYFLPVESGVYLLALLNSTLFLGYAKRVFVGKQGGWYEVQPDGLESFPVATASAAERSAISALVQKCLDARGQGAGVADWEAEINQRVARLYGLTPEEIKIVEESAR
jgi:hypothetical protein